MDNIKKSDPFRIAIIGLGLIGGSLAYALEGFRGGVVTGADADAATREKALARGAVSEAFADAGDAIDGADFIIFCLYPEQIPAIIRDNAARFKPGAVVTDVCGVKARLTEKICAVLPPGVDFVSCHPMAGKEFSGFDHADGRLFAGTGFLITPVDGSKQDSITLLKEVAWYIDAARTATCTPQRHDEIIAYTSHLCHVSAAALCLDFNDGMTRAFTAGAYRDCTRVANINPGLWSELFLENRENIVNEIDRLVGSLTTLREAVGGGDYDTLYALLEKVQRNKKEMDGR